MTCGIGCAEVDAEVIDTIDVQPCPACGFRERATARFCSNCGARIAEQANVVLPAVDSMHKLKGRKVMEETEPPPDIEDEPAENPPPLALTDGADADKPKDANEELAAAPPATDPSSKVVSQAVSAKSQTVLPGDSALLIKNKGTAEDIFGMGSRATGTGESSSVLEHKPLEVVFWFDGELFSVTFLRRPLGLSWKLRAPITIDKVKAGSHAEELGVQKGWQIKVIAGVDMSGKIYRKIAKALGTNLEFLPWAKNDESTSASLSAPMA